MLTLIAGYEELSTRPSSCLVTVVTEPLVSRDVFTTCQLTFGMFAGRRP
jgi:hypothetical protein